MINLKYVIHPSYCGYFCLKHILKRCKVEDKSYMRLDVIFDILKSNNYSCVSCRVNEIDNILYECITLLRINEHSYHYVVLKRRDNKFIYMYDPLFLFVRKMRITKFNKKWSKICLFYVKI